MVQTFRLKLTDLTEESIAFLKSKGFTDKVELALYAEEKEQDTTNVFAITNAEKPVRQKSTDPNRKQKRRTTISSRPSNAPSISYNEQLIIRAKEVFIPNMTINEKWNPIVKQELIRLQEEYTIALKNSVTKFEAALKSKTIAVFIDDESTDDEIFSVPF